MFEREKVAVRKAKKGFKLHAELEIFLSENNSHFYLKSPFNL